MEHAVPAGQTMQSEVRLLRKPYVAKTCWSACVPSGHGTGVVAPAAQRKPAVQLWHAVLPGTSVKVPASQGTHTPRPLDAATVPAAHSLQTAGSELPGIGLAVPSGHVTHDALLDAPTSGLYVPAGQGSKV